MVSARLKQLLDPLAMAIAVLGATYHFLTLWTVPHGATRHYATHFLIIVTIAALAAGRRAVQAADKGRSVRLVLLPALVLIALTASIYLYIEDSRLVLSSPWLSTLDLIIAACVTVVVLGMTWVVWGFTITLICIASIAYMFWGHLLPDPFWHLEDPIEVVMTNIAGMGAVRGAFWAIPLSADTVFPILIFGGLLQGCRVIEMFIEIGKAVGNIVRGGIAYSAVVASTLIAMVTGEAISNVALAGTMTIPTMKARGFSAEQAGGIEVVASSGSQITPPIMSVAAFLMAMILGVPYVVVLTAAMLPAALYFIGITIGITLLIRSAPRIAYKREPVDVSLILRVVPSFVLSFLVLLFLLYSRYSPGYAAFWACAVLLTLAVLRLRSARPSPDAVLKGITHGAVIAAQLGIVLLAIGIIIQMFLTTGVGIVLGRLLQEFAGGQLWIAAIAGSVIAIGIGTALPTPAAYALMTVVIVPALIDLGAEPMAAHFFALYWAAFSTITPPVAVAVLTAVRISDGSFLGTSWSAFKLSVTVFVLPFAFLLHPEILGIPYWSLNGLFLALLILLCALSAAAAMYGHLHKPLFQSDRWLLACGAISVVGYLGNPSYWWILGVMVALGTTLLRPHVPLRASGTSG